MKWMRYLSIGVMSVLLVACGDKVQRLEPLSYGDTILAFGDSVTFGYGVDPQYAYPQVLTDISPWNVINKGISGERADQAKKRIKAVLEETNPKVVIIELGGNDFLQRRNTNAVKEDLRAIIQDVKAYGAVPVLVAVPSLSVSAAITGSPSDSVIYKELGKEENIHVISDVFSNILGQDSLKQDQVHPNQAGYKVLAEEIYKELGKMGL